MPSSYPSVLDVLATNKLDVTGQGSGDHSGHHNLMADAINKIEAELGVNPSGSAPDVATRLGTLQATSEKGAASGYASLDVTGKVPSAQLPVSAAGVPSGAVLPYAGSGAPSGFLSCDGAVVSRATYSALFSAIGDVYGVGDGSTTFALPDYRGRTLVGVGSHADVNALADNDALALADRRPKHKHTVNESPHAHTYNAPSGTQNLGSSGGGNPYVSAASTATGAASTGLTVGPQTNSPTDGPAYHAVNWIIKT